MSHHRIIQRKQLNEPMRKSIGLPPRNTNTDMIWYDIYILQTIYHSTLNVLRHSISQTDILKPHVTTEGTKWNTITPHNKRTKKKLPGKYWLKAPVAID